ncbi:MAG: DUF3422 family protein, partial [Zoogloeaceae bacterium]|nr:DUF3422 family protein [Zoogloeaceae bacterium]
MEGPGTRLADFGYPCIEEAQDTMPESAPALTGLTDHPLRLALNNEIHARPPIPLAAPHLVSFVAISHDDEFPRSVEVSHLRNLAAAFAVPLPEATGDHLILDVGAFRLKWERHTEFSSYSFFRPPE